jgi:hypothetical protein
MKYFIAMAIKPFLLLSLLLVAAFGKQLVIRYMKPGKLKDKLLS